MPGMPIPELDRSASIDSADPLVETVHMGQDIAVLFSGGTDSTLTSALVQERYRKVHLVTFNRMGFHSTENTAVNAKALQERYGEEKFVHAMIRVERLFRWIAYERYIRNVFKHGFHMLSTCGLCKLAMHMRNVKYCVDNGISNAADGANQGMTMEPAQMRPVIDEMRRMYEHFGIRYSNPVFDYAPPEEKGFIDSANAELVSIGLGPPSPPEPPSGQPATPGERLYQMGLAPLPNVKGSKYDRKRQPRCFQFVLFNIFALKYFMARKSYEEYREGTVIFFKDKIARSVEVLEANFKKGKYQHLFE